MSNYQALLPQLLLISYGTCFPELTSSLYWNIINLTCAPHSELRCFHNRHHPRIAAHLFYSQQAPPSTHLIQSQLNLISSSVLPYSPWMNYVVTAALLVQPSYYRTVPPTGQRRLRSSQDKTLGVPTLITDHKIHKSVLGWLHRWTSLLLPNKKLKHNKQVSMCCKIHVQCDSEERKVIYVELLFPSPNRWTNYNELSDSGHLITILVLELDQGEVFISFVIEHF